MTRIIRDINYKDRNNLTKVHKRTISLCILNYAPDVCNISQNTEKGGGYHRLREMPSVVLKKKDEPIDRMQWDK